MAEPNAPSEDPALDQDDDESWQADELTADHTPAEPVPTPALDSGAPEPVRAVAAPVKHANVPMIALSILGGIFLAYTVSWGVVARVAGSRAFLGLVPGLTPVLLVGAVVAPVLWELMLLWGVHGRVARWLFAVVGVVILFPYPLVITMVGGAQ